MLLGVGAGPSYAELVSPPPLPWSLDPQRRLMRSLAASATACAGGAVPLAGAAVLADAAGPPSEAFEEDYGPIDRCTTFKAEPFVEEYFKDELDLENHKACTDYSKYGTNDEKKYCVDKPLTKKDFKRTEASGKAAYDDYKRMRGATDTGVICTDFTLDPDPIKACT